MKKTLGIFLLLITVILVTGFVNPRFFTGGNVWNVGQWTGLYGILSIGVAFVIITGGIDLSIGSVVGLVGCLLPWLLVTAHWSVPAALLAVLCVSAVIGLVHGLLITKLKLQPFVVTLCGLLLYRGFSRWFTADATQGFGKSYEGLRNLAIGGVAITKDFSIPYPFLVLLVVAGLAALFLNGTIYGRYLLALGRNEQATRLSGINTDRMTIMAYVICSSLAGLGGVLFALHVNSVQPSGHGNFYELYAIAAAVLGGCSLRGGEGSIAGVIVGAALLRVLYNAINLLGIPTQLEFAIIGAVILLGVIADELMKRWSNRRRLAAAIAE